MTKILIPENSIVKIIVKPNSPKNEVLPFDSARGAYKIAIAAPPEKDKANKMLLKFISKETGRKCKLMSGFSSRNKLVKLL